jgi:predicted ATPase
LGQASIAGLGFAAPETGRAYARAHDLCRGSGEVPELFPALYGRSVFHFQRGELVEAHEVARELRSSAEKRGDTTAAMIGHRMMGSALYMLGELNESREHFEAALALYEPARDRRSAFVYAIDSRVICLGWLSQVLTLLGHLDQGLALDREVPSHVRALSHPHTTAVALAWSCIFHQLRGDRTTARGQAEAVTALAAEQGFRLYLASGTVVRGWARSDRESVETGVAKIRQGLAAYEAIGARMLTPYFLGLLAEAQGEASRAGIGLMDLGEALTRTERTGARWIEAELHRRRGELLLALPEPDEAEADACLRRSLAVARRQRAKLWELRAATSFAKLCLRQGRRAEGRGTLEPVHAWFTEGLDTPDVRLAAAASGDARA